MEILSVGQPPEIPIGQHCSKPYECEFRGHCWAGMPEFSIYDIPRLSWEKKNSLKAMGIVRFRDVPETFDLNEGQKLCLEASKNGEDEERPEDLLRPGHPGHGEDPGIFIQDLRKISHGTQLLSTLVPAIISCQVRLSFSQIAQM